MEEKRALYLCMGSACHQAGVYEVLPQIQRLLKAYHLEDRVELKGSFCLGACSESIVMKYQETLFTHIRPQNVEEKFVEEILPALTQTEDKQDG